MTDVDSLTLLLGIRMSTHRGMKKHQQKLLRRNKDQIQNVDGREGFGCLGSLLILLQYAIIAKAIIAEIFGEFSEPAVRKPYINLLHMYQKNRVPI